MTHRASLATAYLFAMLAEMTGAGHTKHTRHGALRIYFGKVRIHVDAEEVVYWQAGGAEIIARVSAPVPFVAPVADASDLVLPRSPRLLLMSGDLRPSWRPTGTRARRPSSIRLVGVAA